MKNKKIYFLVLFLFCACAILYYILQRNSINKILVRLPSKTADIMTAEDLVASNALLSDLAAGLSACKQDNDCMYVQLSGCSCENGGPLGVINKKDAAAFTSKIPSVAQNLCSPWSTCVKDEQPICYEKKCYIDPKQLLRTFLQNKQIDAYTKTVEDRSLHTSDETEYFFSDLASSLLSEEEKINLFQFWIEKGVQPQKSRFGSILNNGEFKLAEYLIKHSEMKRKIPYYFFSNYYNNLQGKAFVAGQDPAEQLQKMLFPLENGFSLECIHDCNAFVEESLKKAANPQNTTVLFMALGVLPKNNNSSLEKLKQRTTNCPENDAACLVIQKAVAVILSSNPRNSAELQREQQNIDSRLQAYQNCQQQQDCTLLTFGSCQRPTAATVVNKAERTGVWLDIELLRIIRRLYGKPDAQNWCTQEIAGAATVFNLSCRNNRCIVDPAKPLDIVIL